MDNIIEILREDYARFPIDQSYQIYAKDVYFQDPLTKFRGLKRYQKTIEFIRTWFKEPRLELYTIVGVASPVENRLEQLITTRWSLSWNTPLPWYPRIEITGRSEMLLNDSELIISHIDYWDCVPLDVLKQHFKLVKGG
jgi:Uncharacterized conserved protein (DUF2358)